MDADKIEVWSKQKRNLNINKSKKYLMSEKYGFYHYERIYDMKRIENEINFQDQY